MTDSVLQKRLSKIIRLLGSSKNANGQAAVETFTDAIPETSTTTGVFTVREAVVTSVRHLFINSHHEGIKRQMLHS